MQSWRANDPYIRSISEFLTRNAESKREWTAEAKVCVHNMRDIFYTRVDQDGRYIVADTKLAQGVFKVPIVRRLCSLAVASIMGQPGTFNAVPASHCADDVESAEAFTMLIRDMERYNATHVLNHHVGRALATTGSAFKRVYTQPSEVYVQLPNDGELLNYYIEAKQESLGRPLQLIQQPQKVNDSIRFSALLPSVREQYVSPFSMIVETGCSNFRDCTEFCNIEVWPIARVGNEFPGFDIEKLRPENIQDTQSPVNGGTVGDFSGRGDTSQMGTRVGSEHKMVRIYDYWKRLPGFGWRHTVLVGSEPHVLLDEQVAFTPYINYTMPRDDNFFWAKGLVSGVLDIQRAINRLATDRIATFVNQCKDILVVDPSVKNQLTNGYNQIIVASNPRSSVAPVRIPMATGAIDAMTALIRDHWELGKIAFGLGDASLGAVKSHVSAMAQSHATQIDQSPYDQVRALFDESERQKTEVMLRFAREVYDEPRLISIAGRDKGSVFSKAIGYRELGGRVDVEIVPSYDLPKNEHERLELATKLAAAGVFDPNAQGAVELIKDFIGVQTGLFPYPSELVKEKERARLESYWIETGSAYVEQQINPETGQPEFGPVLYLGPNLQSPAPRPFVRSIDNHEEHLKQHESDLRSGRLTAEQEQLLEIHMREHSTAINQALMIQKAEAIEMMSRESIASQMGQITMQMQGAAIGASATPKKTPAMGGRISGQVRRG